MRLIDANALKQALRKCQIESLIEHTEKKNVFDIIDEQPTAYDVDKVVAELENEDNHLTYGGIPFKEPPITVADAIELVRKGGVE